MPTIPKRVSDRLSKETRKFQRILKAAKDRDINESDTVAIVADMLADVFGFDKYAEITSEYSIRGTFCDLAVSVDGKVKYLLEVKAVGLDLRDTHLRQAVGYGAQHGIQWVVLTNGVNWEIYRIKFEKPLGHELLTSFNYLELSPRKREDQEILFLLCKEGLSKEAIEGYHEHVRSVNKFVISAILQSQASLDLLRRELRRVAPGIRVETDEIQSILLSDVLKRDVLEGKAAEHARARVKKASGRSLKKRRPKRKNQPKEAIGSETPDLSNA
ncbi:MAG TPA: restriction endonuclease subunit R [Anaerolineae bacterium]|nr:restriction endonuclease subunit R [Anaerolineae bacterium]